MKKETIAFLVMIVALFALSYGLTYWQQEGMKQDGAECFANGGQYICARYTCVCIPLPAKK